MSRRKANNMRIKVLFGLLIFLLSACNRNRENNVMQISNTTKATVDTLVGRKIITNEIPGSAYRKRAMSYFLIVDKDTSVFNCIFMESKDNGKVAIDLNIPYSKISTTYQQRMHDLEVILKVAAKDFNFDSLTSIGYGRLILSGDLAIDVTKQYFQKFGTSNKVAEYKTTSKFLKESKLGTDLDSIFKPYSISVEGVSIEKLFFTDKGDLHWGSKIETDSTKIPDKILDCITWVRLQKQEATIK